MAGDLRPESALTLSPTAWTAAYNRFIVLTSEEIVAALARLAEFLRERHTEGELSQFDGLRVTAPTPEYLLAMKCTAYAARCRQGVRRL